MLINKIVRTLKSESRFKIAIRYQGEVGLSPVLPRIRVYRRRPSVASGSPMAFGLFGIKTARRNMKVNIKKASK